MLVKVSMQFGQVMGFVVGIVVDMEAQHTENPEVRKPELSKLHLMLTRIIKKSLQLLAINP